MIIKAKLAQAGLQSQVLSPQMQPRGLAVLTVLISRYHSAQHNQHSHALLELATSASTPRLSNMVN